MLCEPSCLGSGECCVILVAKVSSTYLRRCSRTCHTRLSASRYSQHVIVFVCEHCTVDYPSQNAYVTSHDDKPGRHVPLHYYCCYYYYHQHHHLCGVVLCVADATVTVAPKLEIRKFAFSNFQGLMLLMVFNISQKTKQNWFRILNVFELLNLLAPRTPENRFFEVFKFWILLNCCMPEKPNIRIFGFFIMFQCLIILGRPKSLTIRKLQR